MRNKRSYLGLILGAAMVHFGSSSQSVGPPRLPVKLSEEQQQRLVRLDQRFDELTFRGRMGEALRLALEIESLRRRWQGADHWQTINARHDVGRWERLARLGEADQERAGAAEQLNQQGKRLQDRGRYPEAEKLYRRALAINQKALGDRHSETASCYNHVGSCLDDLARHTEAQAMYEKALAIRQKTLGEAHRDTAGSYNNLAYSLGESGQHRRALPLLRKALAGWRQALGEGHPTTAFGYNNVATSLAAQGQHAQALPLFEKALDIRQRTLGENHSDTATSYNNVGTCLMSLGQHTRALRWHERALAIRRKVHGEGHPDTATSYHNAGSCLNNQGKHTDAQPLLERALSIRIKALGDAHPTTAMSYASLGNCHHSQGKYALAVPLCEKALAIVRSALGEEHPYTATTCNNLAVILGDQGQYARAQPLMDKALVIMKKALGEEHPRTAIAHSNVAFCLVQQGQAARARAQFEQALAITRKALGDDHPHTAARYNALAYCLYRQKAQAEALPLYERALTISRRALGEHHPDTADRYNNLALCLADLGFVGLAVPLFEQAWVIRKKALGEEHPRTATACTNLAFSLYSQGKQGAAIRLWQRALLGHDAGRLDRADSGFKRAQARAEDVTPRFGLALAHAGRGEAEEAWRYAEADLARNLLDDLAGATAEDAAARARLSRLDERLLPLFGLPRLTQEQKALLDELSGERKAFLARLTKQAATQSAAQVWSLAQVQKQLPADAAVVLWVGSRGENWGCVLRAQGPPRWVRLAGTGAKREWTAADDSQPERLREALAGPRSTAVARGGLTEAVRKRWFAPLEAELKSEGKLAAVKRLFVVPPYRLAGLPVEVLAPGYTVSYAPSCTVLAKALKDHRPLEPSPALALGDPVFQLPALAAAPKYGVLVSTVNANGPAGKAGLRAGDVLLRYDGVKLQGVGDLVAAVKKNGKGQATYWRGGQEATVALPMPAGITIDRRPAPEAVRAFRAADAPAVRGEAVAPLPGTRAEVMAIQRLLGKGCTGLLGSAASEQALDALRPRLKGFRVVHLATHGVVDMDFPERSRLLLARDKLPGLSESARRAAAGKKAYTGELTVATILEDWKLDADLVVLSACQTGLGRASHSDGLLGFSYALMRVGARSVVLSRWKVDDKATALLMVRFYENLVGRAEGLKGPMGRAEALAEAKRWLSELPRKDANKLAVALKADKLSGTRGSIVDLVVKEGPKLPAGERPYAHPFYWAAFTLIGDPD